MVFLLEGNSSATPSGSCASASSTNPALADLESVGIPLPTYADEGTRRGFDYQRRRARWLHHPAPSCLLTARVRALLLLFNPSDYRREGLFW